ncbi:hypothetical protein AAEX28_02115 [Lentisphaerota bacterium WC36G]|nr:hypothetical protein LJT99_05000 [Lentisphaerae bacterium WC36]
MGKFKGKWSGLSEEWKKKTYSLSSGEHSFSWVYQKDKNIDKYQDCAWIAFFDLYDKIVDELDPNNADSDSDGIPDGWEVNNSLNPLNASDALADFDNDKLTNLDEYKSGSNPHESDTDSDGLSDALEVNYYKTNPATLDSDNDGISDNVEVADMERNYFSNQGFDSKFSTDQQHGWEVKSNNFNGKTHYYASSREYSSEYYDELTFTTDEFENEITFYYKTQLGGAFNFYIDNVKKEIAINTNKIWNKVSLEVTPNEHTYKWVNEGTFKGRVFIDFENKYFCDPNSPDTDGDGLLDGEEVNNYQTNPNKVDSDNDGINDKAEVINGLNPLVVNTPDTDTDGDGLTDHEEVFNYYTNPTEVDSDNDGLSDKAEIDNKLNPNYSNVGLDYDYDGISDIDEVTIYQTNPIEADTDGDGIDDNIELENNTDPTKVIANGSITSSDKKSINEIEEGQSFFSNDNIIILKPGENITLDFNSKYCVERWNMLDYPNSIMHDSFSGKYKALTDLKNLSTKLKQVKIVTSAFLDQPYNEVFVRTKIQHADNENQIMKILFTGLDLQIPAIDKFLTKPVKTISINDGYSDEWYFKNDYPNKDSFWYYQDSDIDYSKYKNDNKVKAVFVRKSQYLSLLAKNSNSLENKYPKWDIKKLSFNNDTWTETEASYLFEPYKINEDNNNYDKEKNNGKTKIYFYPRENGTYRINCEHNDNLARYVVVTDSAIGINSLNDTKTFCINNESTNATIPLKLSFEGEEFKIHKEGTLSLKFINPSGEELTNIQLFKDAECTQQITLNNNFATIEENQLIENGTVFAQIQEVGNYEISYEFDCGINTFNTKKTLDISVIRDSDNDGLSDSFEIENGLNPNESNIDKDQDNDGINDVDEFKNGLDIFNSNVNSDSDNDGLYDVDEVNIYHTNPLKADSDGDGLSDKVEIADHNTDPNDKDSDNDGIEDKVEVDNDLNPLESNIGLDQDNDEMSDVIEVNNGLNPLESNIGMDSDNDGISDVDEVTQHYTNPKDSDSDGDGLNDNEEINEHQTDPTNSDSDGDGMNDQVELDNNFNPNQSNSGDTTDSDGDGISDFDEVKNNLDPNENNSTKDTDQDGLSDFDEVNIYGTDPHNFDTDGDMLSDKYEVDNSLNPKKTNNDTDGDGLSDFDEYRYGTDPNNADSDGDGINDGAEVEQGSDPTDASDEGIAPAPEDKVTLNLTVGDHSGSHSERWNLNVGKIKHCAPDFGVVQSNDYTGVFKVGESYDVSVDWVATKEGAYDYDYTAKVEYPNKPEHMFFYTDDPNEILGSFGNKTPPTTKATIHLGWIKPLKAGALLNNPEQPENETNFDNKIIIAMKCPEGARDDITTVLYKGDEELGVLSPTTLDILDEATINELTQNNQVIMMSSLTSGSPDTGIPSNNESQKIIYLGYSLLSINNNLSLGGLTLPDNSTKEYIVKTRYKGIENEERDAIAKVYIGASIDIDIDSDNNNEYDYPDCSEEEDSIEDGEEVPGKILTRNILDTDLDGIPNFADGYNIEFDNIDQSGENKSAKFVKVVVEIGSGVDIEKSKIKFTYDAADPTNVTRLGEGTAESPYIYNYGDGSLRLWRKDGIQPRLKESIALPDNAGDYIPSEVEIPLNKLYSNDNRSVVLSLEALKASVSVGDLPIKVELVSGNNTIADQVKTTVVKVETVHPIDSDFTESNYAGRIIANTRIGDDEYYTKEKTTYDNKVAQTEDGKVTISAYVTPALENIDVYFEVIDPDDKSSYDGYFIAEENVTVNYLKDKKPNDNRDPDKKMLNNLIQVTIESYNDFQTNCLSKRTNRTKKKGNKAIAEVTLNTTKTHSGDNYIVRAVCTRPKGEYLEIEGELCCMRGDPFDTNAAATVNPKDSSSKATYTQNGIAQSATLVVWKRIYMELANMYKMGATVMERVPITSPETANTVIKVDNVSDFSDDPNNKKSKIIIFFPPTGEIEYEAEVKSIDKKNSAITVSHIANEIPKYSGVRINSNLEQYTEQYSTNLTRLKNSYGGATDGSDGGTFVEFKIVSTHAIPKYTEIPKDRFIFYNFGRHWFYNTQILGAFLFISAKKSSDPETLGGHPPNIHQIAFSFADRHISASISNTEVHEIGHMLGILDENTKRLKHVDSKINYMQNHESTDQCFMSYTSNDANEHSELCLYCIEYIRGN